MGLELCQLPVSRRLTLACRICGWVHLLPPDILAKKGVRVAVMPTHTWREHDGRAWLYTKKTLKPAPYTKTGLSDAEVIIKPGWSQRPALSATPDVFSNLPNQALKLE